MTFGEAIICPCCGENLESRNDGYFCSRCNKIYSRNQGIISFVEENPDETGYKKEYFASLSEVEKRHFWFRSRNKLILFFIKKYCQKIIKQKHRMLEIGCGNGNVLRHLRNNKIDCQGGDLFIEGLIDCQKEGEVPLYQIDALKLPFRSSFDIIGMFDVVEHIDKDIELLKQVYKALKPQGKILVTVPACKKLWGRYDEAALHKRRYSKKELIKKIEDSGFAVERVTYFISFLLPILILFRHIHMKRNNNLTNDEFLKKEIQIVPFFNILFFYILSIERTLIHFFDLPIGSSLIAVARKE